MAVIGVHPLAVVAHHDVVPVLSYDVAWLATDIMGIGRCGVVRTAHGGIFGDAVLLDFGDG
jgi:hypothetical protein